MKKFLCAVKWEILLSIKECLRYRMGLLMDFLIFTGTFIGVYFFNVSAGFESFYNVNGIRAQVLVVIGYIFWQNASVALGFSTGMVETETTAGIFEMRLQSKYSMDLIWFFRLLISNVAHLLTYVGIILIGSMFIGFSGRDLLIVFMSILLSFISIIGMYGLGLLLGSMCIIEKKVGSFVLIIQTMLLFVTNALSPTRPGALLYIIPFAPGIEIMRMIYLNRKVPTSMFVVYICVNIIWCVLGCVVYRKMIKYEKKRGSFDNY